MYMSIIDNYSKRERNRRYQKLKVVNSHLPSEVARPDASMIAKQQYNITIEGGVTDHSDNRTVVLLLVLQAIFDIHSLLTYFSIF